MLVGSKMRSLSRKFGVAPETGSPLQSMQPAVNGLGVDILSVLQDSVKEAGKRVDGTCICGAHTLMESFSLKDRY